MHKKILFSLSIILTFFCLLAGCSPDKQADEQIVCYIDVVNPETGEHLIRAGGAYNDAFFTYDGGKKYLEYYIVREDTKKIVDILTHEYTQITYIYPEPNGRIFNYPEMRERGHYYYIIHCEWSDERYWILDKDATIEVVIQ